MLFVLPVCMSFRQGWYIYPNGCLKAWVWPVALWRIKATDRLAASRASLAGRTVLCGAIAQRSAVQLLVHNKWRTLIKFVWRLNLAGQISGLPSISWAPSSFCPIGERGEVSWSCSIFTLHFLRGVGNAYLGHKIHRFSLVGWYRPRLKDGPQVWWILLLLLLTTSASTCLQHSRNLGTTF